MFGVILISIGTLFQEISVLIGKVKVAAHKESVYTMGFLQLFWTALAFLLIAVFIKGSFVFDTASLPTFSIRVVLELIQANVTILAIVKATRGAFGFIRSLTMPLLLGVDLLLGYTLHLSQIIGMGIILITVLVLFLNHGVKRTGSGWLVFSAVNAVITISLFKYHITHFNSVVGEQLIIYSIVMIYFFIAAHYFAKENPLQFFKKPVFLFQSLSHGLGSGLESFAYSFAPASIILAAKRSSGVLWSMLSGQVYFHEKHLVMKLIAFAVLVVGIILLAI